MAGHTGIRPGYKLNGGLHMQLVIISRIVLQFSLFTLLAQGVCRSIQGRSS